MRLTARAVTAELHRLGHEARLESGDGYFYFLGLEPATWLDRTVGVPKRIPTIIVQPETRQVNDKKKRRANAVRLSLLQCSVASCRVFLLRMFATGLLRVL
jgi:hypothetical protein